MRPIRYSEEFIDPEQDRVSPVIKSLFWDWYPNNWNIVSVSGARNTSKSHTVCFLISVLCETYPGCQVGIVRQEYSTIKSTVIPTFDEIYHYGIADKKRNPFVLYGGPNRPESITFDNTSKIIFGGMHNTEAKNKVLGGKYDVFFYNEIQREQDRSVFSNVMGCMAGGRSGKIVDADGNRRHLFIGDCNPASRKHWWYRLFHDEHPDPEFVDNEDWTPKWFDITHKDHPLFYNWETKEESKHGKDTVRDLLATHPPGYERDRMVFGIWNVPEGAVFPQFSPERHEIELNRDMFGVDCNWYWACDWGVHVACGLYVEVSPTEHYLFKEIYRQHESLNDVIKMMQAIETDNRIPEIKRLICDHEGTSRSIIGKDGGYRIKLADKTEGVAAGIELARWALANDVIRFNKDSLEYPEPNLIGKQRRLTDELETMEYKPESEMTGAKSDDLPDSRFPRHAADHFRYYCVDNIKKRPLGERLAFAIESRQVPDMPIAAPPDAPLDLDGIGDFDPLFDFPTDSIF